MPQLLHPVSYTHLDVYKRQGVAKFAKNGHIFIGTPDKEEIVIFLEKKDIIAVSSFNSGPVAENGIRSLIFLLRELGSPLVVLPENHPTSQRLPLVASCGEKVRLDCNICLLYTSRCV